MAENKKESKLYSYPCVDGCLEFLEGYKTLSFAEFAETHCGSGCPDCVWLDIPYTEEMKRKDG